MVMAFLLLIVFTMGMFVSSDASWCVCISEKTTPQLQKTIDFACGAGADCAPILQNGACYNPNTVVAHCSYAANSYYQRKNQAQGACDFSGTATLTSTDPSGSGCTYPATPSAAGTSSTPTSTTPATPVTPTTPSTSTTPPSTFSPPTTFSPSTGITGTTGGTTGTTTGTGGVLGSLGPSGTGSYDGTGTGGSSVPTALKASFFVVALLPALIILRI